MHPEWSVITRGRSYKLSIIIWWEEKQENINRESSPVGRRAGVNHHLWVGGVNLMYYQLSITGMRAELHCPLLCLTYWVGSMKYFLEVFLLHGGERCNIPPCLETNRTSSKLIVHSAGTLLAFKLLTQTST